MRRWLTLVLVLAPLTGWGQTTNIVAEGHWTNTTTWAGGVVPTANAVVTNATIYTFANSTLSNLVLVNSQLLQSNNTTLTVLNTFTLTNSTFLAVRGECSVNSSGASTNPSPVVAKDSSLITGGLTTHSMYLFASGSNDLSALLTGNNNIVSNWTQLRINATAGQKWTITNATALPPVAFHGAGVHVVSNCTLSGVVLGTAISAGQQSFSGNAAVYNCTMTRLTSAAAVTTTSTLAVVNSTLTSADTTSDALALTTIGAGRFNLYFTNFAARAPSLTNGGITLSNAPTTLAQSNFTIEARSTLGALVVTHGITRLTATNGLLRLGSDIRADTVAIVSGATIAASNSTIAAGNVLSSGTFSQMTSTVILSNAASVSSNVTNFYNLVIDAPAADFSNVTVTALNSLAISNGTPTAYRAIRNGQLRLPRHTLLQYGSLSNVAVLGSNSLTVYGSTLATTGRVKRLPNRNFN